MRVLSLSFCAIICSFALQISAQQKVGHINTVQLIDSLNEAKQASTLLKQYESSLTKTGEEMIGKYQIKVKKYQADVKTGSLTAIQQKQQESDLQIDQTAINNYRQSAQGSLEKRRQELIQPILDKINKAIQEIGKEENYLLIFDSSVGVLFYQESENLSPKLFRKLGY